MTFRNYILFGLALVVVLTAGFLFAFSGIERWRAAAMALAIVGPMWMIGRPGWMRQHLDDRPQADATMKPLKPQISLIIVAVGFCSTAWNTTHYYRRADWVGLFFNAVLTLWFFHIMYLAIQRWGKLKRSEDGTRVA
jgi:hypothetical protein